MSHVCDHACALLFWLVPLRYQALLTCWSVVKLNKVVELTALPGVRLPGENEVMDGAGFEGVPSVV